MNKYNDGIDESIILLGETDETVKAYFAAVMNGEITKDKMMIALICTLASQKSEFFKMAISKLQNHPGSTYIGADVITKD